MIELRGLRREDVPVLAELQRATAGSMAPMSDQALTAQLYDEARGHGAQTIVAVAGDTITGAAAWIASQGTGFLAPFIARDDATAAQLIVAGCAEVITRGARSIRLSSTVEGCARARAATAAGFLPKFDFVDLVRSVGPVAARVPPSVTVAPLLDADRDRVLDVYNVTFEGVPSSLPMTRTALDEQLASPALFAAGSSVAVAADGELAGFLLALDDRGPAGHLAIVDAVGVRAEYRSQGIGRALIAHMVDAARTAKIPLASATIASSNVASLTLHEAMGFVPRWRRRVWELAIDG